MSDENREYVLSENELLVSTTDLDGNITFADENFVRVSGFSLEELMGKPHNIVRHPDMPKEVFADFWKEIKAGNCWSGIIKNKKKLGGFYWVKSDVIPLYNEGVHIGFMSVRSAPNKTDVDKIKILYQQFKEGEQGKLFFKCGKVVKKEMRTPASFLSIKQRLLGLVLFATISLFSILGVGIYSSYTEKEAVEHLYNIHIDSYSQLRDLRNLWKENDYLLQISLLTNDYKKSLDVSHELKENTFKLNNIKTTLIETFDIEHIDEINAYQNVADQSYLLASTSIKQIYSGLVASNKTDQEREELNAIITMALNEIRVLEKDIVDVINDNRAESVEIYNMSDEVFIFEATLAIMLTVFFVFLYMIFAYFFSRDIELRLHNIKRYFDKVVKQDYLFEIDVNSNDEIDQVLQSLKIMKVQLASNMERVKQKAVTATRIKIALDNVSTNVMIEDNDRNIIYVNPAIIKMFKKSETDLKAIIPSFDADNILGSNIDKLHGDKIDFVEQINKESNKEIEVNGRIFKIVTNPVNNEEGKRIGNVSEWSDRTLDVAVENEIEDVIHAAVNGDFTQRMDLNGKNEFFTMLCENMNRLLEICEVSLADIVGVLSSLAKGDLTSQITADYCGAFGELKSSSNLTVSKLKEMILHIKISADTINTAAKEIAIGNVDLAQRTEKQACSLEVTSSSMEELTITVKQNSEHAKQANNLAKNTSVNALKGGEIVKKVVTNMSDINTSSQEIMNIISVIDSIAFQTNILALNAAVEAARAGEQGRGFAVVATEVRNLAQRSATAAKEVKTLINSSVQKIEMGSKLADQAGESISDIVISIQDVAKLIEEITLASVEQSAGIDQVSHAILEVDDVTQQNAALVEESSAAASSLEEQVANLAIYVAAFDTGEGDFNSDVSTLNDPKPESKSHPHKSTDENDWSEF